LIADAGFWNYVLKLLDLNASNTEDKQHCSLVQYKSPAWVHRTFLHCQTFEMQQKPFSNNNQLIFVAQ